MKKTTLFSLGLILCASLFISCSDDDDDDFPYIVAPKTDVEFKGANLGTVKEGMQGTWWLKNVGGKEYSRGELEFITIKGDKIIIHGGMLIDYARLPEWYDIVWFETEAKDGSTMHSFFPDYENRELMNYIPYIPFRIKDNVLFMGYSPDVDPDRQYVLLEED